VRRPAELTWQNTFKFAGLIIVAVELRQVILDKPVDQGLLLLAAGLLGLASAFRRNGNGNGNGGQGSSGSPPA
jgi:hypothetical protein